MMTQLSLRASQQLATRCRRSFLVQAGTFSRPVLHQKAFPMTTTVRYWSAVNDIIASGNPLLTTQQHPQETSYLQNINRKSPLRILNLHAYRHATLEEKETWLLTKLNALERPEQIATAQVTRQHFLLILRDLADASKTMPGCAVRAENWLGRLERLAESLAKCDDESSANNKMIFQQIVPDAECYRYVIQAWADSTRENPNLIVARAKRWLYKHIDSPIPTQRPDTASYNSFLDAVSKGRALKNVPSHSAVQEHAQLAQKTLQEMIKDRKVFGSASRIAPNTESFNYVIRAWNRCRREAEIADNTMQALRFLEDYQKEYDASVRPNAKSYGMVLDSFSCRSAQKVRRCKRQADLPSDISGLDEVEMMEGVIQLMHQKGGDMAPTAIIYNMLIAAWAQLSHVLTTKGPAAAERVLHEMKRHADQGHDEMQPDARSYLLVKRAWKNSRLPNRAQRAAWWLDAQWNDYAFDGRVECRPTTQNYNIVIRMFAETGDATKAQEYFDAMDDDPKKSILRNSESFAFVIKAWIAVAKEHRDILALRKAARLLNYSLKLEEEDESSGIRSSRELYSGILLAARSCAPRSPSESIALALDVFARVQQSHHVIGALEYARLLQVGLMSWSRPEHDAVRTRFIERLVNDCAEAGLVNSALIRTIAKGPVYYDGWTIEESKRVTEKIFGDWPLPHFWTRNIKDAGYVPTKSDLERTFEYQEKIPHYRDPYDPRRWRARMMGRT